MELNKVFNEFTRMIQRDPNYLVSLLNINCRVVMSSDENICGIFLDHKPNSHNDRFFELKIKNVFNGFLWVHVHKFDRSIEIVSNLIYEAFKNRILHEINHEKFLNQLSLEDKLFNELTHSHVDLNKVNAFVKRLNLNINIPRIAICITNVSIFRDDEIENLKCLLNDKESFYSLVNAQTMFIFKRIDEMNGVFDIKHQISNFINKLIRSNFANCYYAVGTPQIDINLYKESFLSCQWLIKNIEMSKNEAYFFQDYLLEYLQDGIKSSSQKNLIDFYCSRSKNLDYQELVNISKYLFLTNFNIKKTADKLYMNKNTLVYKLKNYEHLFMLDIRHSMYGKLIFFMIANNLKDEI